MIEEYAEDLVSLTDEDGKEYNFEVLDSIDTGEKYYVALTPYVNGDDESEIEDDGSLIIMEVIEEDDGLTYLEIEDDDEYNTIADEFITRLQDYYDIDAD